VQVIPVVSIVRRRQDDAEDLLVEQPARQPPQKQGRRLRVDDIRLVMRSVNPNTPRMWLRARVLLGDVEEPAGSLTSASSTSAWTMAARMRAWWWFTS
jgi:hypothetical protein